MKHSASLLTTFSVIVTLLLQIPAHAYDNDGRDANGIGLLRGGPHRTINELALDSLPKLTTDPILRECGLKESWELLGPTVVAPGMELINSGERSQSFRWWVIEGGYTADEPELYNSFRHFYDPSSLTTPFLTDHLEQLDYVYKVLIFTSIKGMALALFTGSSFNPEVNARDWAITGKEQRGWGNNEYCFSKGKDYLRQAYQAQELGTRRRFFAQAWRTLGETMHLMADMTCVPHVRNDSHPGKAIGWGPIGNTDPNKGYLKNDPYELLTTEKLIREVKDYPVDPVIKTQIDQAANPAELFLCVARYTQEHFFSADTIGGDLILPDGEVIPVKPANGQKIYPFPSLSKCELDEQTGYLFDTINNRKIRMCHLMWLRKTGWGDEGGVDISSLCVKDQASILIPVAIYANARLAEFFLPRLKINDCVYDNASKRVDFKVMHLPSVLDDESFAVPMLTGERVLVSINGTLHPVPMTATKTENGAYCDLSMLPLKTGDKVTLGVELGGIVYQAAPFLISEQAVQRDSFVPNISWVLKNTAGEIIATSEKSAFSHSVPQTIFTPGNNTSTVNTTISANVAAAAVAKKQQSFPVVVTISRMQSSNPLVADLKNVSLINIVGYNGTAPRVLSSLGENNPATISLKLDFNLANNQIYNIDQTANPRFNYPETNIIKYADPQGYKANWNIATYAGTRGITLNGNICLAYYLYSSSDTLSVGETAKLNYNLYLYINYRYQP